ncbi:MAG: hypothetical protein BRD55_00660 [Bacteroidetes bacterium SW_9_63_38]|nr:MAG: hypothetical protein BRD55_00660 [Bacteroidetes bacterium SW_9_63_38]
MNWWQRRSVWEQSALIGSAVTGGLSSSYMGAVNACCCLGVILGALVAVYYYAEHTTSPVRAGDGAVLGAVSGGGGAVLATAVETGMRVLGMGVRGALEQAARVAPGAFHDWTPIVRGHEGWEVLWMIIKVGAEGILFGIFGAVGGAVGAVLFSTEPPVSGHQEASGGGASKRDGSD